MRRPFTSVVTVIAWAVAAALAMAAPALKGPDKAAAARDAERLQGTWYTCSLGYGTVVTGEDRADTITYEGNRYISKVGGQAFQAGTFHIIDATAEPKQIEYFCTEGASKGIRFRSIYTVDDDGHRICSDNGDNRRPKEFSGKAGFLRVTRREGK
jgi:uncharacterized protein (TIGR03067 family)